MQAMLPEPRPLRPLPVGAVLKRLGPSGLQLRGEDIARRAAARLRLVRRVGLALDPLRARARGCCSPRLQPLARRLRRLAARGARAGLEGSVARLGRGSPRSRTCRRGRAPCHELAQRTHADGLAASAGPSSGLAAKPHRVAARLSCARAARRRLGRSGGVDRRSRAEPNSLTSLGEDVAAEVHQRLDRFRDKCRRLRGIGERVRARASRRPVGRAERPPPRRRTRSRSRRRAESSPSDRPSLRGGRTARGRSSPRLASRGPGGRRCGGDNGSHGGRNVEVVVSEAGPVSPCIAFVAA